MEVHDVSTNREGNMTTRTFGICLFCLAASLAWPATAAEEAKEWGVTADLTVATKYMTDGFNVGGDHTAWMPSVAVNTTVPGFFIMFWSALPVNRDRQQYDEYDFMARYSRNFLEGSPLKVNLHGYFDYWVYPHDELTKDKNGQTIAPQNFRGLKFHGGLSLLELLPLFGSHLVPSYNYYYWTPDQKNLFQAGAHHELFLSYSHDLPTFIPGAKRQDFTLGGSLNYHDGVLGVEPGWSHTTAHASTSVDALGCTFGASVNYQWSYIASVDPENEFWATVSVTKKF
jgi:hypothetical protein